MKNLTFEKANELADLAAVRNNEYRSRHPSGQIWGGQELKDLVREPESAESAAFKEKVRSLTKEESLDAVALMYVGRGDYLEKENHEDPKSIREAFDIHHESFSNEPHAKLTEKLLSKGAAIHEYLDVGAGRVIAAFAN